MRIILYDGYGYVHLPSEYYKEAKGPFNIKHKGKENPKQDPRRWNTNSFAGLEVISWYSNFPGV